MLVQWWISHAVSLFSDIFLSPSWKPWQYFFDFPSRSIFLIPLSYHQTFRDPKCLSFEPGIFDSYCYLNKFNSIYSTHSSEKSLLFKWRWKSNLGSQFSLCHLRTLVLLWKLGPLFLDLKRFVIFVYQRWHASCGILSTLYFHIGFWLWALTQIITGTLNILVIILSPFLSFKKLK